MSQNVSRPGAFPAGWLQFSLRQLAIMVLVAAVACWWWLYKPAGLHKTGRELDVAICGRGYFVCTSPTSGPIGYSRRGDLSVNSQGQLCIGRPAEGWLVEPSITIPSDAISVSIAHDGNVYFYSQGQIQAQNAGQLNLATFIAPDELQTLVPGFYAETDESGQPHTSVPGESGAGWLQQGYLKSPEQARLDMITLLLFALCSLVGWLACEVRGLRLSLRLG